MKITNEDGRRREGGEEGPLYSNCQSAGCGCQGEERAMGEGD